MSDEHLLARRWRQAMGLTLEQLAALTGYSKEAVFLFERGRNSAGRTHDEHAWHRYKTACLGVRFMLHFKIDDVNRWDWA